MRIAAIDPGEDGDLAERVLAVQRAAYQVEASLIGDDRIPPLHEDLARLRAAPLRWLGDFDDAGQLVGAVAWSEDADAVDIDRLMVDPAAHRRGVGGALVHAVLDRAGPRRAIVSTGRRNLPARRLYERLGFEVVDEVEVEPDLWIANLAISAEVARPP